MKKSVKEAPVKNKILFYGLIVFSAIFLFAVQIVVTGKKVKDPEFRIFPEFSGNIEKMSVEDTFEEARSQIIKNNSLSEEELKTLEEEGFLSKEEKEEFLQLIIKEKNGSEKE